MFCYTVIIMTLYTKKGDDGTTGLFGSGERISKTSAVAKALGTLDELNSIIGICRAKYGTMGVTVDGVSATDVLFDVQQHLFIIQAEIAGADKHIDQSKVDWLEKTTDTIESQLEPITSFLLPGASELSSFVDFARTVARRAERRVIAVMESETVPVSHNTIAYCNRLSSLLYAMVRLTNDMLDQTESAPTYQ